MTRKKYAKLQRAFFTRLNEWAKANGTPRMDMGKVYKAISTKIPTIMDNGMTRQQWWDELTKMGSVFGVGQKAE